MLKWGDIILINLPLETIKEKIKEKSGISDQELDFRIKKKLDQLSGLISKEGAAHIVANELGVKLLEAQGAVKIKNIMVGMKNLELDGKAIRKYEVREFKTEKREGKLAKFLIGDETGTTLIVLWNDKADLLITFKEGDILKIKGAMARENNGKVELHLTDSSTIDVNPAGVELKGAVSENNSQAQFQRPKADRKKIKDLSENDQNIEVLGTIVQIFDIKFFKLNQETGKRMKDDEAGAYTYSCVLNIFIDDGTDNIRTVLWKNQVLNLLGINEAQLLEYRDSPELFETAKTDLLGMIVKIIGRVTKNTLFNRLELTANVVFREVNPDEEIKRIEKETPLMQNSDNSQMKPLAQKTFFQDGKKAEPKKKEELAPADIDDELMSLEDIEDLDEDL
jgi:hypothetical protein